ncbi:hypothetical protein M0R19_09040, partial [Candidatus Pacearchaeota archaeon]|nr:hypothetical protein [Candidatus Pacearchaeota archaeon]
MKNKKTIDSSVHIGDGNQIQGDGIAIGPGAKVVQNKIVVDQSKQYKIKKQNVSFFARSSPYLIRKLGQKGVMIAGIISFIASIFTIITGIKSLFPSPTNSSFNVFYFNYFPSTPQNLAPWVFLFGLIIGAASVFLFGVIQYYNLTYCEKCGKEFTLKEIGDPIRRDLEIKEGIHRTT